MIGRYVAGRYATGRGFFSGASVVFRGDGSAVLRVGRPGFRLMSQRGRPCPLALLTFSFHRAAAAASMRQTRS